MSNIKESIERLKEKYPNLKEDLGFLKLEKNVLESEKTAGEAVEEVKKIKIINLDKEIEDIGEFMKQIVIDVEEGSKEPIKGYIELKRIEKGVKNYLDKIKNEAYDDLENWDKNDLPYGYTGMITNRLNINFEQDNIYKEHKDILEEREKVLKNVVEQNKKGFSVNNSDGVLIDCPDYSYTASLVIKKKR